MQINLDMNKLAKVKEIPYGIIGQNSVLGLIAYSLWEISETLHLLLWKLYGVGGQ